jgi:SNF2 family DNA or RNA helicase
MPTLRLDLSLRPGFVRAQLLDTELQAAFFTLASSFGSSSLLAATQIDIEVDDFLSNVAGLLAWPDEDVEWGSELEHLVRTNYQDFESARQELEDGQRTTEGPLDAALLSSNWVAPLTTFQERDIQRLIPLNHGANFSVPGAGKTRVALALYDMLNVSREGDRLLVVCPKSAFESWEDENLECFRRPIRMARYLGSILPGTDALLINYERLADAQPNLIQWLRQGTGFLVLDEAHRMKRGPRGVFGRACLSIGPYARKRLILTGTPAPNSVADLQNLMAFVWPGLGRDLVNRAVSSGDLASASRQLRPLFVRTKKSELDLPEPVREIRRVPLTGAHRTLYDALLGHFDLEIQRYGAGHDFDRLGRVTLYLLMAATSPALLPLGGHRYEPLAYQLPPLDVPDGLPLRDLLRDLPSYELSPKFAELAAILTSNRLAGRKTLVWSTFVRNLTTLNRLLRDFNPAMVHGGTADRRGELERFRDDANCWVLLSNPATLGEGISLHHTCQDAVYVDRDFAAGRFLQSLDRIHRLGLPPNAEIRITVLLSDHTIDEVVEARLASKLDFMGRILDDPDIQELADLNEEPSASAGLDPEDIRMLLGHLHGPPAS